MAPHIKACDNSLLIGSGVRAYLDVSTIVKAAVDSGCDALHPGYGFLSESWELAEACGKVSSLLLLVVVLLLGSCLSSRLVSNSLARPLRSYGLSVIRRLRGIWQFDLRCRFQKVVSPGIELTTV